MKLKGLQVGNFSPSTTIWEGLKQVPATKRNKNPWGVCWCVVLSTWGVINPLHSCYVNSFPQSESSWLSLGYLWIAFGLRVDVSEKWIHFSLIECWKIIHWFWQHVLEKKEKQYDALFASLISMAFYLAGRIDFQLLKTWLFQIATSDREQYIIFWISSLSVCLCTCKAFLLTKLNGE